MRFSLGRAAIATVAVTAIAFSPTMAGLASGAVRGDVLLTPALITLGGQTPTVVLDHEAADLGANDPAQPLTINLVLPLRHQGRLNQFLADQDTTGQTLSQGQIADQFLPAQSQVDAIGDWAALHNLHIAAVSANRTLVTVEGTTGAIQAALSVRIHGYRTRAGRRFFSNDRDATVPSTLGVAAISGLDNLQHFQTSLSMQPIKSAVNAAASTYYKPANFRTAYNVTHDGSGQTIGFTLWGSSLPQSDLNNFAFDSGDPTIVAGQSGANGIDWIFPTPAFTPATYHSDALDETAMDVEYAHAMAPNAHLKYYLGDQFSTLDTGCGCYDPTNVGLENAVAAAASPNDPNMHVVSNSWLGSEPTSINDSFLTATQQSFQIAKAAGITFYFASGDSGSSSGGAGAPAYPADSPYVVAVGGTTLNVNSGTSTYGSESTWSGSGGGCSVLNVNTRPSWQVFTGTNAAPTCAGRAEPDIAADGDPNTGAYVDYNGSARIIGGTSLATPLWAGMTAATDSYALANGGSVLPFTGPVIYGCANNAAPYPSTCRNAYHDVTTGNNGADSAGTGWDEATGWGSINWQTWTQDVTLIQSGGGATATTTATPSTTATATRTATSSPTATGTSTPSALPSNTATASSTATVRPSVTGTATSSVTASPTLPASATSSPTTTWSPTATETPTNTAIPTSTMVTYCGIGKSGQPIPCPPPVGTSTNTATPPPTATFSPTATMTTTPSPTVTATASATPTSSGTATVTTTPSNTGTAASSPTMTTTPTKTSSPTVTATGTATPSLTASSTASPTTTSLLTATDTAIPTSTMVTYCGVGKSGQPIPCPPPIGTSTNTATFSPTATVTTTPSSTLTATATATPPNTGTATSSPTVTTTPTKTSSPTVTATGTVTGTATTTGTVTATSTATATTTGSTSCGTGKGGRPIPC